MECPHCGQPEGQCYLICPSQDPYHGDQAAENADYEFNARFDDNRERYAATAEDADMAFEPMDGNEDDYGYDYSGPLPCPDCEDDPEQYAPDRCPSCKHGPEGFRPNDDGTVTYISPAGGEHTYDPADVFKDTDGDNIPL